MTNHFAELRRDGGAQELVADATFWADLMSGRRVIDGWLVSRLRLADRFDHWERHRDGEEIVVLMDGAVDLDLEEADGVRTVELRPEAPIAIVPRMTWHFGRALEPSGLLFITPAGGTDHKTA